MTSYYGALRVLSFFAATARSAESQGDRGEKLRDAALAHDRGSPRLEVIYRMVRHGLGRPRSTRRRSRPYPRSRSRVVRWWAWNLRISLVHRNRVGHGDGRDKDGG